jgi:WD40 repeat protein
VVFDIEEVENDATVEFKKFFCKDFLISTTTAAIGFVTNSGTNVEVISRQSDSPVFALCCHPFLPRLCFGNTNGYLQLWDYEKKVLISSRNFGDRGFQVSAIRFDTKGSIIGKFKIQRV